MSTPLPKGFHLHAAAGHYEISAGPPFPSLRMQLHGRRPALTFEPQTLTQVVYRVEASRGYDSQGDLWSPGYFRVDLGKDEDANLVASTEPWETSRPCGRMRRPRPSGSGAPRLLAQFRSGTQTGMVCELVLAADQFIIRPAAGAKTPP